VEYETRIILGKGDVLEVRDANFKPIGFQALGFIIFKVSSCKVELEKEVGLIVTSHAPWHLRHFGGHYPRRSPDTTVDSKSSRKIWSLFGISIIEFGKKIMQQIAVIWKDIHVIYQAGPLPPLG